jgi:RNA polymerase sigma-70 factor (ECF subfamily)
MTWPSPLAIRVQFTRTNYDPPETERVAAISEEQTSPEDATLGAEMRALLEKKLDELPTALRTVFVMRQLEEMTVEDTAECLGLSEAAVHSRLSQAKFLFRASIEREIDLVLRDVFAFGWDRCERIVEAVLGRITDDSNPT